MTECPRTFFHCIVALAIATGVLLVASTASQAQVCSSTTWGPPYSLAGALEALGGITPSSSPEDANEATSKAEDHLVQLINFFALRFPPPLRRACWRCDPYTRAPDVGMSALEVAEALSVASGGTRDGILQTIKDWKGWPWCTVDQVRAADAEAQAVITVVPPCERIAGVWAWFVNGDVTFRDDGTLVQGSLTGRWTCADSDGEVTIEWSHGYTDRVKLSDDGKRLTGTNNQGATISGVRKTASVAAIPPLPAVPRVGPAPTPPAVSPRVATPSPPPPPALPRQYFVYVNTGEFTCCKDVRTGETPHPLRVGEVRERLPQMRMLAGPFGSADAARQWACSRPVYPAQAHISNWARVEGVLVSNLPCQANVR
jgi:hypothetical protein